MSNHYKIFDVSLIGPKHQRTKKPNQDSAISVRLKYCDVLVVADGIGSHDLSHLGSQAVCRAVIKVCKMLGNCIENMNATYFLRLVHTTWLMLLHNQPINQCGATCLICIKTEHKIHILHLGDGLIALLDNNDNCHLLINNERDFGNLTHAMNIDFNQKSWQIFECLTEKVLMVMLCTDGISDDIMLDKRELWVRDFYSHYCNSASKHIASDVRKWLKKWSVKHHHDDKTIACLIRDTTTIGEI